MAISKCVILCGGNGTRMKPFTDALPKELLPIIRYPVIDFIMSECKEGGIRQVCFVMNKKKDSLQLYIEQHFQDFDKTFVMQDNGYGTATAVLSAQKFIGNDDFCVVFPDEIAFGANKPLSELLKKNEETNACIIGCKKVSSKDTKKYGIIELNKDKTVKNIIEKPIKKVYSHLAMCGRFVFCNDFLPYLTSIPEHNGEKYLTDAINVYVKDKKCFSHVLNQKTFDCGNPVDFYKTNSFFAKKIFLLK